MAPRLLLPADDLYARLEVPPDATPEAIEIAWRALLRRHHPDVAGPRRPRHRHRDQCRPRLAERPGAADQVRPGARDPHRPAWARGRLGRPRRTCSLRGPDPAGGSPRPAGSWSGARRVPRPGDAVERRRARPARLRGRDADRVRGLDRTLPVEGAAGGRGQRGGRAQHPPPRGVLAASARPRCRARRGTRARAGRVPRRASRRTVPWPSPRAPDAWLGRGGRPATLRAGWGRCRVAHQAGRAAFAGRGALARGSRHARGAGR